MKRLVSILLALTMISSCLALAGCDWSNIFNPPSTSISKDPLALLKDQIVEDYLIYSGIQSDKKPEEIEYEFLGQYGDSAAVYFHTAGAYEHENAVEEIAGCTFNYPDTRVIRIYNNGKFYTMPNAYEMRLISESDVQKIHSEFKNMEFSDPCFYYEHDDDFDQYSVWDHPLNMDTYLCTVPGLIIVYLDKSISRHGKEFDIRFFDGIDYLYIAEVSYYKDHLPEDVPEDKLARYRQTFHIYLRNQGQEAMTEAIKILSDIEGIIQAIPMHLFSGPEYNYIPNDDYYDDGNMSLTQDEQWVKKAGNI